MCQGTRHSVSVRVTVPVSVCAYISMPVYDSSSVSPGVSHSQCVSSCISPCVRLCVSLCASVTVRVSVQVLVCVSLCVSPGVGMCQSGCQSRCWYVSVCVSGQTSFGDSSYVILCQYVCQPMCPSVSVSSCVSSRVRLCQSVSALRSGVRQASGRAGMLAEGQPRADKSVSRLMARENSSPGCFLSQQSH